MGLAYTKLMLYLRKGNDMRHMQWDSTRKGLMVWENLYGAGTTVMGYTIYSRYRISFTATARPTIGLWFEKIMTFSKFRMGEIKEE